MAREGLHNAATKRWRHRAMRLFCAALAALALASPAAAETASFARRGELFFTDCLVDQVLERCQIDTGSYEVGLRPRPEFESYPAEGVGQVMGATGAVLPTRQVRLGALSFGGFKLRDVDAAISDSPFDHSIIGLELIERLGAVTFDFRRNELRRGRVASRGACDQPFDVLTRMIRVPVQAGGQPVMAAWDTGASTTVADEAFIQAHPEVFRFVRRLAPGTDATATGVPVSLYRAETLSFCGRDFHDVAVVAVDMSRPKAMVPDFPDLTLGANLMAGNVWSFDFRDRSWSLD